MKEIKKHHINQWKEKWDKYKETVAVPVPAQTGPLGGKRLKIYEQLRKAENSVATQIRSEKIGFAAFLHQRKVPGVESPACRCGWGRQTAKHIIMFCRLTNDRILMNREINSTDYMQITHSKRAMKIVVKWLMKQDLLSQFKLASELLYEQ